MKIKEELVGAVVTDVTDESVRLSKPGVKFEVGHPDGLDFTAFYGKRVDKGDIELVRDALYAPGDKRPVHVERAPTGEGPFTTYDSLEGKIRVPQNARVHELKCWIAFFCAIIEGKKNFELRKNDRQYREGDVLMLREWSSTERQYTNPDRVVFRRVTYVTAGENWLKEDVVALGLARLR